MTSKYLPRDPTPEMVEAVTGHLSDPVDREDAAQYARDLFRALWDAAPSLPLKRTEPPRTTGLHWYWCPLTDELRVAEVFWSDDGTYWSPVVANFAGVNWFGPVIRPEVEP